MKGTYHHEPRDKVQLLDDVEQVEEEQDASDPEAAHGAKVEPIGPRVPVVLRDHDADRPDKVEHLLN